MSIILSKQNLNLYDIDELNQLIKIEELFFNDIKRYVETKKYFLN